MAKEQGKRPYIVTVFDKDMKVVEERIVNASHPAHAVRHVVKKRVNAEPATKNMDKVMELSGRGIKPEEASED